MKRLIKTESNPTAAIEIAISTIRDRIMLMNVTKDVANKEAKERLRNELNGMMLILKKISSEEHRNIDYSINYYESGFEFGYYDNGEWYHISGVSR